MRRGLRIGGISSVHRRKVQICFRRLLCNKIVIDQLQCVICRVLGNYDKSTSGALEKQNRNGKKHKQYNFSN